MINYSVQRIYYLTLFRIKKNFNYGGGFVFPPNPGGSIGDMLKVLA